MTVAWPGMDEFAVGVCMALMVAVTAAAAVATGAVATGVVGGGAAATAAVVAGPVSAGVAEAAVVVAALAAALVRLEHLLQIFHVHVNHDAATTII